MSEEMVVSNQTERKPFMSKPYSKADRDKEDEEELEVLLREQRGEGVEETEESEPEPVGAEEKTFKKRYGDLRRHTQKVQEAHQKQIDELKEQLKETSKKPIVLPKTDEELEKWMSEYPDVAAIVETIATKKAREQSEDLEDRVTKINKMQDDAERQKAETLLLQIHPDFEDIRDDDQFHTWAEEQPKWVQQALYDNDNDAKAAARAIDLYKSDFNIGPKKKQSNGDAAEMISSKKTRTRPTNDDSEGVILESAVQKMSMDQYAKNQEAIMEAMNKGTFIYDISGSAR